MKTINLTTHITTTPDLTGFNFYVKAGEVFDADDYAEAYGLNRADIDHDDIKAAQNFSANLNDGEWLLVEHEAA